MRKYALFIGLLINLFCYSQSQVDPKLLVTKYSLPENFFHKNFNSVEYIYSFYNNLSRPQDKNVLAPKGLIRDVANYFLSKKKFDIAFAFLKLNIRNYPQDDQPYKDMGNYYLRMDDKERGLAYHLRAINIKYKRPFQSLRQFLKIDSAIIADHQYASKQTGQMLIPSEALVRNLAATLLKNKNFDKAYALLQMNLHNYPNSFAVLNDLGDYYDNEDDSLNAFKYWSKAMIIQYDLPGNFFDTAFNPSKYLQSHYSNPSMNPQKKGLPPERLVNSLGYVFLTAKIYKRAHSLFEMNIENYPQSSNVFDSMGDYFTATGNNEKAKEFYTISKAKEIPIERTNITAGEVIADSLYNVNIDKPVCSNNCPVILFDGAHNNYHKANGRYQPFAKLMSNDGFIVQQGQVAFTKKALAPIDVVVIASPGEIKHEEVEALNVWIRNGGALLAITDHDNFTIDDLLNSLGIKTPELNVTEDSLHAVMNENGIAFPRHIIFSKVDKQLGKHPVITGRNNSEEIKVVKTFSGRTIIAPSGSSVLLPLSKSAKDYMSIDPVERTVNQMIQVRSKGMRCMGVALNYGKGKVVVVSEAAMLTAQLWPPNWIKLGMNTPGSDNRQFALNIMRWLTGYLK